MDRDARFMVVMVALAGFAAAYNLLGNIDRVNDQCARQIPDREIQEQILRLRMDQQRLSDHANHEETRVNQLNTDVTELNRRVDQSAAAIQALRNR